MKYGIPFTLMDTPAGIKARVCATYGFHFNGFDVSFDRRLDEVEVDLSKA